MAANQNRERLREAAQFIKQGDYKSAQAIFRELIKASPRDAELWYLYSFAATESEHQIKSLEKALTLAPEHEKAKQRLAQLRGEAPVPPKVPAKSAIPSYALMVSGGLVSLVVVVLIGFVLSRSQQGAEVLATAAMPSATFNIVTRKPTDIVPTQMPTQAAIVDQPTFVPSSTRPTDTPVPTLTQRVIVIPTQRVIVIPTETPTNDPMPDLISSPASAAEVPLTDLSEVGGGTGRILYPTSRTRTTLNVVDLNDGTIGELAVVDRVEEARWVSDGLQVMLSKDSTQCGSNSQPCVSFITLSTGAVTTIPNLPSVEFPALSPDRRQIAYVTREERGQWAMWVADIDGTNQRRITEITSIAPFHPVWSPDSRLIAYSHEGTLYVIASDGTNSTPLTSGIKPSWSPDGKSLIYISQGSSISRIDLNGQNEHVLLSEDETIKNIDWPIWSPDGQLIAFVGGNGLYIMKADGSDATRVASPDSRTSKPSWQPLPPAAVSTATPTTTPTLTLTPLSIEEAGGGTGKILFHQAVEGVKGSFQLFNLHDKTVREITLPEGVDRAWWTSDGRQLLVNRFDPNEPCIGYTQNVGYVSENSATVPCVGFFDTQTQSLSWIPHLPRGVHQALSPDQRLIAFIYPDANEHLQVWVADVDGTDLHQITNTPDGITARALSWTSDSRFIAYNYQSVGHNKSDIHLIALDGSGDRVLIENGVDASVSPDGTMLVYVGWDPVTLSNDYTYIFTADIDGGHIRQLTFQESANHKDTQPAWSSDGRLIAFIRNGEILYVMNADGSNATVVSQAPFAGLSYLGSPSWQPLPSTASITATPTSTSTPTATATSTATPTPTINPANLASRFKDQDLSGRTSVQIQVSPNNYIGGDYADAEGNVTVEGTGKARFKDGRLDITLLMDGTTSDYWSFAFAAPNLEIGRTYDGVVRDLSMGDVPAMDISSPNRGCGDLTGQFTIEQVTPEIVVHFTQMCGFNGNQNLTGVVTFRSE